ncbi:MAG: MBL fold metallo-hydrolase [Desulfobacterales bacterium]|nr:MBL fold metallo-hydrolase [Desulfobacterales bacterium]
MKCWITKNGLQIHRVLLGRCNCYLVTHENRFLLMDSGTKTSWKRLVRGLDRFGVKEDSSVALALTHCHFDHAENAARFKETYKAPILIHRSEGTLLKNGDNPEIRGTIFYTKVLTAILSNAKLAARLRYEPAEYDVPVDEALRLEPYGIPGYLLHTPGHTPGSVSAIIDDEIGIVGDAMFGIFPGLVFPPFAVDVPLMVKSWKNLLDTGCSTFLPAHGSERSAELLKNQYDKYRKLYNS